MKRCYVCKTHAGSDPSVSYRERMPRSLSVLCSACHVDATSSSTVAVKVESRDVRDRYALMAERFGVN